MPELPDVEAYVFALNQRLRGAEVSDVRLVSPFVLRSVAPAPKALIGDRVDQVFRLGKRLVFGFASGRSMVLHLMIAGRLHWHATPPKPKRITLALFGFDTGTLELTEAGSKKRASLHLLADASGLTTHDPGGLEVLTTDREAFTARLRHRNHTLKRVLTDPQLFSGIGNAYSDEILHAARLSPVALSQTLSEDEAGRLYDASREILTMWRDRLVAEAARRFPAKVTAFRSEMAVHGRFGLPCPACTTAVQRIRHAHTETNYCPACQTGGRILADRVLSRVLNKDWPRTLDELDRAPIPTPPVGDPGNEEGPCRSAPSAVMTGFQRRAQPTRRG